MCVCVCCEWVISHFFGLVYLFRIFVLLSMSVVFRGYMFGYYFGFLIVV